MDKNLGLRVLSDLMGWDHVRATDEYAWLRMMSRIKYDEYRDFLAGVRFVESLVIWLQQFDATERDAAYAFVKKQIIFISPAEMEKLINLFFPQVVQKDLIDAITLSLGVPRYKFWTSPQALEAYDKDKRKTLFMALSDGARIGALRRSNVGIISNEQVVVATQLNKEKWQDLLNDLREEIGPDAKFSRVYLIDDFTASGTSLIRKKKSGAWSGKLKRFLGAIQEVEEELGGLPFEDGWKLTIHHYLGTSHAKETIEGCLDKYRREGENRYIPEHEHVTLTFGVLMDDAIKVTKTSCPDFYKLIEDHYDPSIENDHNEESGVRCIKDGYGQCALPIILEHNTPNNSISLLWAESEGSADICAMRPLFRRRQRHS